MIMLDRQANTIYDYTKPSQSMSEQIVSAQLLHNATLDAANRKPPIPNIGKTAKLYGYRQTPPTIEEVLNVDAVYPAKFGDFSGSIGGYAGTAYPSIPAM
jgi:hypothetical protein